MAVQNTTVAGALGSQAARQKPVVKAILIEVKAEDLGGQSQAIADNESWAMLAGAGRILDPPLDPLVLTTLPEVSTEMGPCIEAMEVNCDGFGYRLKTRIDLDKANEKERASIVAERVRLLNFFQYASLEHSFTRLRTMRRHDYETTGNAYWEIIRGASGVIQGFEHLPAWTMRLSPQEKEAVEIEVPILELQIDGSVKVTRVKAWRRFRRYVQQRDNLTRWFKQFGDPRVVDNTSGETVPAAKIANWDGNGNPMPASKQANEVKHWADYCARSPYGLPRYVGALLSIFGDREAESINFTTFKNNNIPSMILAISNGQLTQETIDRIKEFSESNIQGRNYSKFLVLEAESQFDGDSPGQAKIDIKPLSSEQHSDALFQNYSKENRDKVRRAWRLPPILVGRADDYTRATADTSRRLADEQVFSPEREEFDLWINRELFPAMDVVYHLFHSNSPNTTDNAELVRILGGAEKTGGMTPRIARMILEDVLSQELPPLSQAFDVNIPFSLSMAEAVKNLGDASEPGQTVTALKTIDQLTSDETVDRLLALRDQLDEEWRTGARMSTHEDDEE